MDRALKASLSEPLVDIQKGNKVADFVSYLILHSPKDGILKNYTLSQEIQNRLIEKHIYIQNGEKVESFLGANAAIGVLILKYETREAMNKIVDNFEELYTVSID